MLPIQRNMPHLSFSEALAHLDSMKPLPPPQLNEALPSLIQRNIAHASFKETGQIPLCIKIKNAIHKNLQKICCLQGESAFSGRIHIVKPEKHHPICF